MSALFGILMSSLVCVGSLAGDGLSGRLSFAFDVNFADGLAGFAVCEAFLRKSVAMEAPSLSPLEVRLMVSRASSSI